MSNKKINWDRAMANIFGSPAKKEDQIQEAIQEAINGALDIAIQVAKHKIDPQAYCNYGSGYNDACEEIIKDLEGLKR